MRLKLKTILYPTDFSEASRQAFELACSLARDHSGRIVALHVGTPPLTITDGVMAAPVPMGDEYDRPGLEALLGEWVAGQADIPMTKVVSFGFPADQIVAQADGVGADMIVMGTHGRSGLGRLLVGSVAEQVLRRATCPVLLVKARKSAARADKSCVTEQEAMAMAQ